MTITLRKSTQGGHYYYTLHDRQSGLFEKYTLTAVWGPKPDGGRRKVYGFETLHEKDRMLRRLIRARLRSGYRVFYSYSRSGHYLKVFHDLELRDTASHTPRRKYRVAR